MTPLSRVRLLSLDFFASGQGKSRQPRRRATRPPLSLERLEERVVPSAAPASVASVVNNPTAMLLEQGQPLAAQFHAVQGARDQVVAAMTAELRGRELFAQGVRDQIFGAVAAELREMEWFLGRTMGPQALTAMEFAVAPWLELLQPAGSAGARLPQDSLTPHAGTSGSPAGSSSPGLPAAALGAGHPVPLSLSGGSGHRFVPPPPPALTPFTRFAYVANSFNRVYAFVTDATDGFPYPVPGSPFPAGMNPISVAVDPTGRFVYVANSGSNSISAYTIDAATGAPTPLPGSPFPAGIQPVAVTLDPTGPFA